MNGEEDTFFEEEEYEEEEEEEQIVESFPDEEDKESDEVYDPRYGLDTTSRLTTFAENPWPTTTFILMVAGFLVVFAPSILWEGANRYFLIASYILIILCGVASAYSLVTWEKAQGSRLRWAGLTNLVVVILCGGIGTLDSISWVISLQSFIPGIETPLISLTMVLVIFSIYTLWIVQKQFSGPRR